jgi:hypothetical protein
VQPVPGHNGRSVEPITQFSLVLMSVRRACVLRHGLLLAQAQAQDRDHWRALLNTIMNVWVL